jgi:hypothetical protein
MEKEFFSSNKKAILIFIFVILTVPFYESKRAIIWETQRPKQQNEIFSSIILVWAEKSEAIKEKFGLKDFFEKEHLFWLKIKKSPLVFGEKNIPKKEEKKPEIENKEIEEPQVEIIKIEPPYKILIIGDSFIAVYGGVGDPLERELLNYKDVEVFRLGRVSSGLSRPDYFNWNLTAKELISQYKPNVAIVMLGSNDAQGLTDQEGKAIVSFKEFGKEKWNEEYRKRVSELIEIFEENDIFVFWVGLPIMKDQKYSEKINILNKIYQAEVLNHKNAKFISTWELLVNERGDYTAYLTDEKGEQRLVRVSDGIHLTFFGGKILVKEVVENMAKVMQLELKEEK